MDVTAVESSFHLEDVEPLSQAVVQGVKLSSQIFHNLRDRRILTEYKNITIIAF